MPAKKEKAEETAEDAIGQNDLSAPIVEGIPLIYARMAAVMDDINAVVKTKQGTGVNYAFRSIEDVMNTVHPVLSKHQVFLVPIAHDLINNTFEKGGGKFSYQAILKSAYRFYTIDGSYIEASMVAESIDYSDKATQQASSYIYKNIILQTFCVPTRELMGDGDNKSPDRENEKPAQAARHTTATRQQVLQDTRLSDRPPIGQPAPAEQSSPYMPNDGWQKVKDNLAQFNMTDNAWYGWTVEVLKQHGFPVPEKLELLPREHGVVLFKVSKASNAAKEILYKLPEPAAETPAPAAQQTVDAPATPPPSAPAPAAPSAPTHSGPVGDDEFN